MNRTVPFVVLTGILVMPAVVSHLTRRDGEMSPAGEAELTLLILSPHNESIRREFGEAFAAWYRVKTGKSVAVDWRNVGGANECIKYLNTRFAADFERREPALYAAPGVAANLFNAGRGELSPAVVAAREAFSRSGSTAGLDIFFGGGADNFSDAASVGQLVAALSPEADPAVFAAIPESLRGQRLRDERGRWHAAALSGFGIVYNRDLLKRAGAPTPVRWDDFGDARFAGLVGLADPTKSGTAFKAYEGLVTSAMRRESAAGKAREAAWRAAFTGLTRLALNAGFWADSASGPVFDTARGDVAAAMAVDFYGRAQAVDTATRGGGDRVVFTLPEDSALSADPVAVLRGAPHPELAAEFVRFVLSPEGQRLWVLPAGAPGGPKYRTLFRLPVRPEVYPAGDDANPFAKITPAAGDGKPAVSPAVLKLALASAVLDVREEMSEAARAIAAARRSGRHADAELATAVLCDDRAFALAELETAVRLPAEKLRGERLRFARARRQACREAVEVAEASRLR